MKKLLILFAAAFTSAAVHADAPPAQLAGARATSAMMYFTVPFGSVGHQSAAPAFGFRLDRVSQIDLASLDRFGWRSMQWRSAAAMLDFRLRNRATYRMSMNGVLMFAADDGTDDGSAESSGDLSISNSDSWRNPWFIAGAIVAIGVGGSCLTKNWPCNGSHRSSTAEGGETGGD